MGNDYYNRFAEMNPGELADGLALEDEFEAIQRGFDALPTPHRDGQGFEGAVRVGDAVNDDEAVNKGQFDAAMASGQPLNDTLTALAGVPAANDAMIYFDANKVARTGAVTPFARTLLDDTTAVAARATLGAQPASEKGAASGLATLDADSKVPIAQLPAIAIAGTFEALRRSYAEAGYSLIGTFSDTGLVVVSATDVVLWEPTGVAYAWSGALVHTIGIGETPVGNPLWLSKSNALLGSAISHPITWGGFAGGAKMNGVDDDSAAYNAAGQSGDIFTIPEGKVNTTISSVSLFNQQLNSLGHWEQMGTLQYPINDYKSPFVFTKYSSYVNDPPVSANWDSTAVFTLVKAPKAGVPPKGNSAAVGAYMRGIGSEGGDLVGLHAKAEFDTGYAIGTGGGGWGAWISAVYKPNAASAEMPPKGLMGIEVSMQNSGVHATRIPPSGAGEMRGLIVVNAGDGHLHSGIDVARHVSGFTGKYWSGIRVKTDCIVGRNQVSTDDEVGESILIEGAVSNSARFGGIRFHHTPYTVAGQGGHFAYGIHMADANFNLGTAISLGKGQKITWDGLITSKGVSVEADNPGVLTLRGYVLAINDYTVVGQRKFGMSQLAGTADGAAKNTETMTLVELARYVKKITDALFQHGLIAP